MPSSSARRTFSGTLYVVATPIGNLEDVTLRAIRILKEVDLIAAEDTRRTRKLLHHYQLSTRQVSLHEHNEVSRSRQILSTLRQGKSVALVSDAGTPGISDPGAHLVHACREAGIPVVPIPGPSAVATALSASGFSGDRYLFLGYPPEKKRARKEFIQRVAESEIPVVVFEAPHRIQRFLSEVAEIIPDRTCVFAREMTKMHEECKVTPVEQLREWLETTSIRGEISLVFEGVEKSKKPDAETLEQIERELEMLILEKGMRTAEAADLCARLSGVARKQVYDIAKRLSR